MHGGAVVLAAGMSSRFGSDKRTHVLATGRSLLHTTLARYNGCFQHVVVVLRPADDALALEVRSGYSECTVVVAHDAHLGMGHSLAAGVGCVADWDYAFIALADMPYVENRTLAALRRAMERTDGASIVLPMLEGRAGHPVGFGSRYFPELRALSGDAGARQLVARHRDRVIEVPLADRGILRDVDTRGDVID